MFTALSPQGGSTTLPHFLHRQKHEVWLTSTLSNTHILSRSSFTHIYTERGGSESEREREVYILHGYANTICCHLSKSDAAGCGSPNRCCWVSAQSRLMRRDSRLCSLCIAMKNPCMRNDMGEPIRDLAMGTGPKRAPFFSRLRFSPLVQKESERLLSHL